MLGPVDLDCVREAMPGGVRTCLLRTLEAKEANPAHEELVTLLGPDYPYTRLDWVICGGESGPGARPMKAEWVRQIRDRCDALNVPFFFKQWGGVNKKRAGRLLDNRTWDDLPRVAVGAEY